MRVSLSWIARLLGVERLPIPSNELQQLLTLRTTEIDEVERTGPNLAGVVVGKVLTCVQHPNADRLRCTTVDIGAGAPVPVVCGAPNVAAGQTVAVATVGTTLTMPGKDGAPATITIKAAKLRGEPSQGMICAEDELGLGTGHDGIMVLPDRHAAGTPLASALGLGDEVLVVDNHGITNRPDLWGHWGWAREIAAICNLPAPAAPDTAWSTDAGAWSVDLRDDGCGTYCGAVVEGVANAPSPQWMQDLLQACGLRPLGLLVDVTNYVMLELGEPMHAFDRRRIAGRVVVRAAAAGEAFTTLDGRTHALAAGDLLIADDRKALALAGIMGGADSMVAPDTDAIVLEAANFRPERIRRTRIRLGIGTDSAQRFEKGLPPELAPAAIGRAIELLRQACPGLRVVQRFSAGAVRGDERLVDAPERAYRRLMGTTVHADAEAANAAIDRALSVFGFERRGSQVVVPWWRRKDIHAAVDLVEEVARLDGLERIVAEVPRLPAATPTPNPLRAAEHRVRRALSAQGWDEVATYGFTADAWAQTLDWDAARTIRLDNPLSAEWTLLRRSLVPGLAEAVARNRKQLDRVACYEIGKAYGVGLGEAGTPDETLVVSGLCAAAGDETPFYAARDAALAALRALGHDPVFVPEARGLPADDREFQAGRVGTLLLGGQPAAWCGELARPVRDQAGCPERVGAFTIALERLVRHAPAPKPVLFRAPSRFQAVAREFTWICPETVAYGRLAEVSTRAAGALCAGVELITVYRGAPYAAGEKAVSLKVVLQAEDRTLDEKDLAKASAAIARAVEAQTGAKLRAG